MPTVYAISSGTYSDYGVNAIFSTREKAEAWIAETKDALYQEWNDIEEYELDPDQANAPKAVMRGSIDMESSEVHTWLEIDNSYTPQDIIVQRAFTGSEKQEMFMYFENIDENGACKILSEKRAQLIARYGKLEHVSQLSRIFHRETLEESYFCEEHKKWDTCRP